jgi:UDP-N-acetylmuramoyl-tripeptide--D-alanyl-D-alanine ligase
VTVWSAARVAEVLGVNPPTGRSFRGVSTDTRTLEPGDLFVALVGERFDGHDFLDAAVQQGAAGAVIEAGRDAPQGLATFPVPDTLTALGALATARRREVEGPVVAVTGTNGKTATKELLARALSPRWRVHATRGNLNNLVGVPLTILAAPDDAGALVIEAGASVPGEIARLRRVVEPTVGVVTNVSAGHLEGFRSFAGILAEKLSLLEGVALAVVGSEPPQLAAGARRRARRVLVAGTAAHADVRPQTWHLDAEGHGVFTLDGVEVPLPLVGRHQLENAVLALAVARQLGVALSAAAAALAAVVLPGGRCEVLRRGELVVLNDSYNANPASMAASLETAQAMRGSRPFVVVLGSMLELGEDSGRLHDAVARRVLEAAPDLVAVTGAFVAAFAPYAPQLGERLIAAADAPTLGERLAPRLASNAFVLLKASRGVRLEQAIPFLLPE